MKRQLLSILLTLVMVIGIMPVNAFAEDIGSDSSQSENYGEFTDGEQVISDMIDKNGMYAHPRIIMSEERFAKLKASIGADSVTGILLDKLRNEADRHLNEPVSQYEIPDGIRLLETSKRIQRRVAALAIRLKKIENDSFNYLDLLWIDEEKNPDSADDSPTDWGEVGASNASFRNTWDESGIVAALHVGTNNYKYHGHYDLGSFYIESNGERFFTDLGNEQYELPNRLYSYRIRAEGHNTLVINPSQELDQQEGAECLISSFRGGNEAYAVADLTAAYKPSGAESVVRGLKMIKDKECVIIQDEISLNAHGEIYWFAHTKGQIDVADDGRSAVVTVGSEKMWVEIISDGGEFSVMNAELLQTSLAVSNQTDNSSYRKLAVHLTNTKDTTISVACIPLKQGETQPSWIPSVKALSEWTPQTTDGDVNADGVFNIADLVLLQKWLSAVHDTELKNWKAADLCDDNKLDAFDLVLMKQLLIRELSM